ncbi:hypothetical protein RFH42_04790 [Acinetobacter rudis]|uniref:hypothetical protein n=1 Tax=Acinetobacter rudis TaxID=632955 RepID=UPI00280EDF7B|nr:hypothetical protein [Acinetobacter rudis]MDQ8952275.1 hypothetical protein [Acinetobacter rudis]
MLLLKHLYFKRALFLSLTPLALSYSLSAQAGMEMECSPNFDLTDSRSYNECSNLPVLTPGNDNKTNILLLLTDLGLARLETETHIDQDIWSANYAYVPFEAKNFLALTQNKVANQRNVTTSQASQYIFDERCINLTDAAKQFNAQIQQHPKLSASEKKILIQARNQVQSCDDKHQFIAVDQQWSQIAQQYASYINASIAFYNANYSAATKIYTVLSQVEDPWIKETAQYMLIRSSLNSAFATGVDQYGDIDINKINPQLLKSVQDNILTYLQLYPHGQYVASAQGLLRRYFWLAGRQDLLINEIVWQMHNSQSPRYNLNIAELPAEIDRRIFQSSHFNQNNLNDPLLLAVHDLMQMRDSNDPNFKALTWSMLNAQKNQFKTQPELFKYLQASHLFYVQNKAADALTYLPQSFSLNSHLDLSQAFLKGLILEKTTPHQAASYWTQLLKQSKNTNQRGLFEVALAQSLNQQQNYQSFIGKRPLISQVNLQRDFILFHANEQSLEKIIQSSEANEAQKQAALFVLLAKSLGYQNFALFNRYYEQMPKDANQYQAWQSPQNKYQNKPPFAHLIWNGHTISPTLQCAALPKLSQALEKNPQDLTLQTCLAEYMRSENAYSVLQHLDFESPRPLAFNGTVFTRGQVYKNIIATKQKSELTAYALYRSVQCYAPSGFNDCQDKEVPKTVRKQWFDQLKRDYPQSSWAKSLKYYW